MPKFSKVIDFSKIGALLTEARRKELSSLPIEEDERCARLSALGPLPHSAFTRANLEIVLQERNEALRTNEASTRPESITVIIQRSALRWEINELSHMQDIFIAASTVFPDALNSTDWFRPTDVIAPEQTAWIKTVLSKRKLNQLKL